MKGCSKAPWGLSVLRRGMRIFTHATISPSLSLRQRPSRYAIRAGRNLPDKEFRYLRTVIVTAAIHQGFDSRLPRSLKSVVRGSWLVVREMPSRPRPLFHDPPPGPPPAPGLSTSVGLLSRATSHEPRGTLLSERLTPPVNLLALGRRQPL